MGIRQLIYMKAASGDLNPLNEYTVTGNPVTFETNKAKPLTKLLCAWTPTQSGSGDPAPDNVRPIAGMDGVNVWQYPQQVVTLTRDSSQTVNGITWTPTLDTSNKLISVHVQGARTASNNFYNLFKSNSESIPVGSYKVGGFTDNVAFRVYAMIDGAESKILDTANNQTTFTVTAEMTRAWMRLQYTADLNVHVDEVICPIIVNADETITAYSVAFPVLGKNLLTGTPYGGVFFNVEAGTDFAKTTTHATYTQSGNEITLTTDSNWYGCVFATGMLSPGTYNIHTEASEANCRLSAYVTDADLIVKERKSITATNVTITLEESARIAVIITNSSAGSVVATNIQVESGSSYTGWEPYTSTCYGGSLDLTTGVLTATWVEFLEKWKNGTGATVFDDVTRKRYSLPQTFIDATAQQNAFCNIAKWQWSYDNGGVHFYTHQERCYLFLPNDTDGETDVQIVGQLATPVTYQLTPQQVTALLDDNTIWSDANGACEVKYLKKG